MDKQEIEKRCNKIVADIEKAEIYDGRGVYDLYECENCSNSKVTTYKVKGVTPFVIKCDKCTGIMRHTKSSRTPFSEDIHNWVRPTLEQTLRLPQEMCDYVLRGGLIMEEELK